MKISYLFHILLILFFAVCNHDCHPQCLDYLPPFEPSSPLQFCVNYRDYGCCDNRLEERIKWDYEYMARDMNSNVSLKILKDILCLQCHPYAAHVFDAESGTDRHSTFQKSHMRFPGLCRDYCYKLFEEQRDVLLKLAINKDFVQFINSTNATEFCNWAQIGDLNYCYPDLDNTTASKESVQIYHKDQLCVEPISGPHFANALVAVHSNDQSHRLFVGEQRGLVFVILPNGTKIEKPFLNITDKIVNSGVPWDERGFLGLVFHPEYKTNGRFFVYYSAPAQGLNRDEFSHSKWYWGTKHRIRISEYTVHPDHPNMADHSSELPLLEIDQPEPNHNGGMLLFGTDGYLYVFVGDGGGSGDQHGIHGNGLLMSTMLGKILRIDVNVEHKKYGIPKDNPFVNFRNVKDEIYALGIRNTWRCSVDLKGNGRMFCGDVGQNRFEEINIIKKGRNYGWRAYEGFSCFDKDLCRRELKNLEFPIIAYPHSVGRSIVGGYVYRGCQNPNMYGKYFFADTMNGKIFSAEENPGTGKWDYREIKIGDEKFCNNGFSSVYHKAILSFGESESGEIYLLSTPNPHPDFEGSVLFRLVDPLRRNDPKQCVTRVIEAKPIKTIKRRAIFEKYQKEKDKVMKSGEGDGKAKCRDSGSFCKHYRPTKRRKKPLLSCLKTKHLSKRYCPVTCNFCPK